MVSRPPSLFLPRKHIGRGGSVYFETPCGMNLIHLTLIHIAPTPRSLISGVGGLGCIKFVPQFFVRMVLFFDFESLRISISFFVNVWAMVFLMQCCTASNPCGI